MSPELTKTLVTLLGPFAIGWAIWVTVSHMKAKNELDAFKLKVAEDYAKNGVTDKIFEKLDELSRVVYEIAGKLNVPIKKD